MNITMNPNANITTNKDTNTNSNEIPQNLQNEIIKALYVENKALRNKLLSLSTMTSGVTKKDIQKETETQKENGFDKFLKYVKIALKILIPLGMLALAFAPGIGGLGTGLLNGIGGLFGIGGGQENTSVVKPNYDISKPKLNTDEIIKNLTKNSVKPSIDYGDMMR